MKIKQLLSQTRRDFRAIYKCEHCGHEKEGYGYDDTHFHENVIPKRPCPQCGKTSPDTYVARGTKYPDSEIV